MSIHGAGEKVNDIQKANDFATEFARLDIDGDGIISPEELASTSYRVPDQYNETKKTLSYMNFFDRMDDIYSEERMGKGKSYDARYDEEVDPRVDQFGDDNFGIGFINAGGGWGCRPGYCKNITDENIKKINDFVDIEGAKLALQFLDSDGDGIVDAKDMQRSGFLNSEKQGYIYGDAKFSYGNLAFDVDSAAYKKAVSSSKITSNTDMAYLKARLERLAIKLNEKRPPDFHQYASSSVLNNMLKPNNASLTAWKHIAFNIADAADGNADGAISSKEGFAVMLDAYNARFGGSPVINNRVLSQQALKALDDEAHYYFWDVSKKPITASFDYSQISNENFDLRFKGKPFSMVTYDQLFGEDKLF